jgi:hypothetical protein
MISSHYWSSTSSLVSWWWYIADLEVLWQQRRPIDGGVTITLESADVLIPQRLWIGCIVKKSTLDSCDREVAAWIVLWSTKVCGEKLLRQIVSRSRILWIGVQLYNLLCTEVVAVARWLALTVL